MGNWIVKGLRSEVSLTRSWNALQEFENKKEPPAEINYNMKLYFSTALLRCVHHSLLHNSCVTDVLITCLLHFKFTSLQYRNAVVGTETEIQPLQLTATQLQWTMNAALQYSTSGELFYTCPSNFMSQTRHLNSFLLTYQDSDVQNALYSNK